MITILSFEAFEILYFYRFLSLEIMEVMILSKFWNSGNLQLGIVMKNVAASLGW